MRAAIGLGIFGGGGIGYKLYMAMRVLHYQDATALITMIVFMLLIVENTSNFLRGKLLGEKL
jgi:phosphonate transport system permease protein